MEKRLLVIMFGGDDGWLVLAVFRELIMYIEKKS